MLSRNAVIIFAVAALEFFVFTRLIDAFGFGATLLGSVAIAAVGVFLLRKNLAKIPAAVQQFVDPATLVSDRSDNRRPATASATKLGLNALGALLLIVPGFVSSAVGALLFLPPVRALAGPTVQKRMEAFQPFSSMGDSQPFDVFNRMRQAERRADGRIVDVDTVDDANVDDANPAGKGRAARPELH